MIFFKCYLSLVIFLTFSPAMADIAIAGASSKSIGISSKRFEDEKEYYLEIEIVGVDPRSITLLPHGQMLVLEVRRGNIKRNARAGSQEVFYTYSFGDDANMHKMMKLHLGNKIKVAIPKY